jgi:hypothetical protein
MYATAINLPGTRQPIPPHEPNGHAPRQPKTPQPPPHPKIPHPPSHPNWPQPGLQPKMRQLRVPQPGPVYEGGEMDVGLSVMIGTGVGGSGKSTE